MALFHFTGAVSVFGCLFCKIIYVWISAYFTVVESILHPPRGLHWSLLSMLHKALIWVMAVLACLDSVTYLCNGYARIDVAESVQMLTMCYKAADHVCRIISNVHVRRVISRQRRYSTTRGGRPTPKPRMNFCKISSCCTHSSTVLISQYYIPCNLSTVLIPRISYVLPPSVCGMWSRRPSAAQTMLSGRSRWLHMVSVSPSQTPQALGICL